VVDTLVRFARDHRIDTAHLSGIGAFADAEVGFFDRERKEYDRIPVREETEVLSLLGNLTVTDEGPRVHAHVTLGRADGSAMGGHLFEGHVGATLEIFGTVFPATIRRVLDEAAGLPLMDL
jgi:predicted DNA-binding protein with PD1-like motif